MILLCLNAWKPSSKAHINQMGSTSRSLHNTPVVDGDIREGAMMDKTLNSIVIVDIILNDILVPL